MQREKFSIDKRLFKVYNISMKPKKKKIRSFTAQILSEPKFRSVIYNTDKAKKDPKIKRRRWKVKGEY